MGCHGGSCGGRSRGWDVVGTHRCSTGSMTTAGCHMLLLLQPLLLLLLLLRPAPSGSKNPDHGILGDLHRLHRGMNEAGRGGHGLLRRRLRVQVRRGSGGQHRRGGRRRCGGRCHHHLTLRRTMVWWVMRMVVRIVVAAAPGALVGVHRAGIVGVLLHRILMLILANIQNQ